MTTNIERTIRPREGLLIFRWLMIVGSFAPLFLLFIIKGSPTVTNIHSVIVPLIPEKWFMAAMIALAVMPTALIGLRIRHSLDAKDSRTIVAGDVTDSREHLLIYLFALVLPLYQSNFGSIRDVWANAALVVFVFYVLYHLNLHYMNLLFSLMGYRVYTIRAEDSQNASNGQCPFVILSKRHNIPRGTPLYLNRISDTVYIEYEGLL